MWGACYAVGSSNMDTNNWYLETGVYNGIGISVYINGILQATGSCSNSGINYGSIPTGMIGWKADNSTNDNFNGLITDVQVYNSVLASQQIYQLYLNGIDGLPVTTNSLIGWWPLNGNSADYSGNGNNGVVFAPANNMQFRYISSYSGGSCLWRFFLWWKPYKHH